jgi:hypothetical protein
MAGTAGTVATVLTACGTATPVDGMWPGAEPEWPEPAEVLVDWPGGELEWKGLDEVWDELLVWPGADDECPGLVDVLAVWPGADDEWPGLVDVLMEWPGANDDAPGPMAPWPLLSAGAVALVGGWVLVATERGGRPEVLVGVEVPDATLRTVWSGAEPACRLIGGAVGTAVRVGVSFGAATARVLATW